MSGLHQIANELVSSGKGILAADESIGTMSKRLEAVGVPASADARRTYREMLLTAPQLADQISGVILCEETLRQTLADGTPFATAASALGIKAGIKVDAGVVELPLDDGAKVTEGLDGLSKRLEQFSKLGATFAKWRAVLSPTGSSQRAIHANAHALARYAAACQEAGIVPIVEPEVLMEGTHDAQTCQATTTATLRAVFEQIDHMGVDTRGIILKPNMVISGNGHAEQSGPDDVAQRTAQVLNDTVPTTVPGIAFLSGGQSNERACANLAAINCSASQAGPAPWPLTFSFGRALVDDALRIWHGDPSQVIDAQRALVDNSERAAKASLARTNSSIGV